MSEDTLEKSKSAVKGPLWMGLMEGIALPLQAVVGGLCVLLFGLLGTDLFPTFGFLAPLGFTEGPGQALSFGKVWETFDFTYAATIGLTFAAIGFLFAFFVGVPLANWGIRKGRANSVSGELPPAFQRGIVACDDPKETSGTLTTHSGNVDSLAFHIAMIGVVYLLTYGILTALSGVIGGEIGAMLWGFFFFMGLIVALIVKNIVIAVGYDYLICEDTQRRITGWSVDFLIVATVMAIQIVIVVQYLLPILVTTITVGVVTTLVVIYFGRRVVGFNHERTVAIYGTVTGTVSSGLLLLRIVDPEFKTPVAMELGFMLIFAAPVVLGSMLLVNAPVLWGWSLELTILVFLAILGVCVALLRILGLWGKPQY